MCKFRAIGFDIRLGLIELKGICWALAEVCTLRISFSYILFISVLFNLPVSVLSSVPGSANGRYCCSKIFVNHRCFSGPYLNKGRIAELPQAVGPGKCTLVLKEVG